jgi:hypothetical protein
MVTRGRNVAMIFESDRRKLAIERRENVRVRNGLPQTISAEHQKSAEKSRAECGAQDIAVAENRAQRKPSPSPRPAPKAEREEILGDSHGERNPRCWHSLTTGQTGIGAPGRNGTRHPEPYIWKTIY